MSTPDYMLTEDFNYQPTRPNSFVIAAGTFLRPIDFYYVPRHIREENKFFNKETEVYCYCYYGILVFPKEVIRKV